MNRARVSKSGNRCFSQKHKKLDEPSVPGES
jgi:hypothetical protein